MLKELYKMATPWAKANKLQIQKNRVLGGIANVAYPIYCSAHKLADVSLKENAATEKRVRENVIISLTSYPARIESVNLCVESLLRQSYKADHVILWLSREQFPHEVNELPSALCNLRKKGLTIRFVDGDDRSYKKFIYAAREYTDSVIVTADDDALYPEDWLAKLVQTYKENPECVSCYRAHYITMDNGKVRKYGEWIGMSPDIKGPNMRLIPIGVGGVLYPPQFFKKEGCNIGLIKEICPSTDDLWLKAMGVLNGYSVVKVVPNSIEWFTLKGSQKTALAKTNAGSASKNDEAWGKLDEMFSLSSRLLDT